MLKTTGLFDKSAFMRNNSQKLVFKRNNSNSKIDRFGNGGVKFAKKSEKSKGWKLAKSKNLSKSRNLPKFYAKKAEPSFLISNVRMAFNRLRLIFTEAPILWHFNPKCYIWIEIDTSSYAIGDILSQ